MHCLLKWINTESSKQQCPMDRRPWGEFSLSAPLVRSQEIRSMYWMPARVTGVIPEDIDHLSWFYPTVTAEAFAAPVALPDPQAMVT
jgi:hypothetical protein